MDELLTYDFEMEAALHYYLLTGDISRVGELVYQRAKVDIDHEMTLLTGQRARIERGE